MNEKIDTLYLSTSITGKWVTQDIPDGEEIFGIRVGMKDSTYNVLSLAFDLWQPFPKERVLPD